MGRHCNVLPLSDREPAFCTPVSACRGLARAWEICSAAGQPQDFLKLLSYRTGVLSQGLLFLGHWTTLGIVLGLVSGDQDAVNIFSTQDSPQHEEWSHPRRVQCQHEKAHSEEWESGGLRPRPGTAMQARREQGWGALFQAKWLLGSGESRGPRVLGAGIQETLVFHSICGKGDTGSEQKCTLSKVGLHRGQKQNPHAQCY